MVLWLLLAGSVIMSLPIPILGEQRDWLDIPYAGLSGKQKLNISLPVSGDGPFPVIVSIHANFDNGDKMIAPAPPVHGYAVVAVNFRSFSEAKFPAQIQDIKAAIRWVRANAKVYHFNPDKIAVWGESAGGYLAALAGTSGDVKELEDLSLGNPDESSRVQAVIDWIGAIDLFAMCMRTENGVKVPLDNELDWLESEFLGKKITDAPELVKAINPETYITPDDPPFFIQHGTADKEVPVQQSINFAAKLEKTLGKKKVTLDLLKGAGHRDPIFSTWDNLKKALDFLDKYLK
jgi:acetyl esterase/lipase